MNKSKITLLLGLMFSCVVTAGIAGNDIPLSTVSMSSVLETLQGKGYVAVRKVDYEDGMYKVEAVTPQGEYVKIRVNPNNGSIINPRGNFNGLSVLDAIKKVEAAGYTHIYEIESNSNAFAVKALDRNGKKAELEIDAHTGKARIVDASTDKNQIG